MSVYVSNHGGRQLDLGRGSAEVLPEIVAAVTGRAKVYVDGGFSRGTDIIKGIALGADLVLVGRLYCYALAAAGAAGVKRMLEILGDRGAPEPRAARRHQLRPGESRPRVRGAVAGRCRTCSARSRC